MFLRSNKIKWVRWCAVCLVERRLFKWREAENLCLSAERRWVPQKTLTTLNSSCNTTVDF